MNTTSTPAYTNNTNGNKGKFKPYRNRPGKRQALLELFSFLLILTSVPAFMGGVFSIFVALAAFVLGIIGLFAWTRRHAKLFVLLAICVIAAAIVSIILRGTFHAQCVPFFNYDQQFNNGNTLAAAAVAGGAAGAAAGSASNGATTGSASGVNGVTTGVNFVARDVNSATNNNGQFNGQQGNTVGHNGDYDNSIWCGSDVALYVTNALIILWAILGLIFALSALNPRNKTPVAAQTTETAQTHTRTTVTENY